MNDSFFKKWINTYPAGLRREFHRDGIINDKIFSQQKLRILFVAKEPNSKDGNFDQHLGADLRKIWGELCLKKPFDYNVARWTRIISDDVDGGHLISWAEVAQTMRRVAIINLKKMAGSGSENREEVCLYSFQDKHFIKEQLDGIRPDVIFACGKDGFVFRMLWRIINDEVCFRPENENSFKAVIHGRIVPIFSTYHPSLRLKRQKDEAADMMKGIRKRLLGT